MKTSNNSIKSVLFDKTSVNKIADIEQIFISDHLPNVKKVIPIKHYDGKWNALHYRTERTLSKDRTHSIERQNGFYRKMERLLSEDRTGW
jgi:hypothetical protein